MHILVVGLGAIGGFMAARLGAAGHHVSALARGATLTAVRETGLRLTTTAGDSVHALEVSDRVDRLTAPDLMIITLKAPALATLAADLAPLIGPNTVVMPAMNGVPWWFLQPAPFADPRRLAHVDPHGRIESTLPLAQVLSCVVHLTCSCPEPGHVRHGFGDRLIVAEPAGGPSARLDAVAEVLDGAGFGVERSTDIRRDIWFKLWGNMTMNPISALSGAPCDAILDDALVHAFMADAMGEAAAIGERIGCPITQSAEERMALTRQLGAFKTSMLQDAEAGRTLELDALVGAVHEIGQRFGVPTPAIGALFGLTRLMARRRGLYPA
jgi:2-dehydropantoate 2-reductase